MEDIYRNIHFFRNEDLSDLDKIKLKCKETHIWMISLNTIRDFIKDKKYLLNTKELDTVKKFYFKEHKLCYMTGRILTKILASNYLGVNTKEIVIERNLYGKPFIVTRGDKKLQYNLSHSGEYLLIAFNHDYEVGIDVEEEKFLPEYKEISKNFHKREYERIYKLDNISIFYKFWTAKEAYVKAVGKGLNIALNSFYISKNEIYENGILSNSMKLLTFKAGDKYPAAIVINDKEEKYAI